jgi:hypothetical protein
MGEILFLKKGGVEKFFSYNTVYLKTKILKTCLFAEAVLV